MRNLGAALLAFIYAVATGSGFDVLLPYLKGYEHLKPFAVWTPLLLLAVVLNKNNYVEIFEKYKSFVKWVLFFALITVIHTYFFTSFQKQALLAYGAYVHFFVLFILFSILLQDKNIERSLHLGFLTGLVIAISLNLIERLVLFPFTAQYTRSAGFFLNPNGSSEAMIFLLLAMFLGGYKRDKYNLISFICLGIATTFSRSGLLMLLVALILLIKSEGIDIKKLAKRIGLFAISYGIVFYVAKNSMNTVGISQGAQVKMSESEFISYVADRASGDSSASQRIILATDAITKIFNERIFLGEGIGVLRNAYQRTHNFFLEGWLELGVFSLLFIPLLIVILFGQYYSRPLCFVFGVVLFVACVFSHNIINAKIIIYALALAYREIAGQNVRLAKLSFRC